MQRRQLNIKGNSSERLKTIIPDVLSQLSDIKHVWGGKRKKKKKRKFVFSQEQRGELHSHQDVRGIVLIFKHWPSNVASKITSISLNTFSFKDKIINSSAKE